MLKIVAVVTLLSPERERTRAHQSAPERTIFSTVTGDRRRPFGEILHHRHRVMWASAQQFEL